MRIEIADPSTEIMDEAIIARSLIDNTKRERNGRFVVYEFTDITPLDMFKLGECFNRKLYTHIRTV